METWQGEVGIRTEGDIVVARRTIREAAMKIGFGLTDVTRIVTAASELARNIFKYASEGSMFWRNVEAPGRKGLEIQFLDHGPGIENVELALSEGYSTSNGLGLGLPGAKRLMDEFELQSSVGKGTTVTLRKWRSR
jgi:serine/threonine-protein kinase RsbT